MAAACREALQGLLARKMDFEAFERLCLRFGVHHHPRTFYEGKLAQAVSLAQGAEDKGEALKIADYWRNVLASWDWWATRCRVHGLPVTVPGEQLGVMPEEGRHETAAA